MKEKVKFRRPVAYKILYTYTSVVHRLFYRKITVAGFEKIPINTPVIFAPNHQNALMDALAVLFAARRPVVFMARADIFKKPFIAKLLNFLRILPIYRIRDGYAELGKNQDVFDETIEVLNSNIPICILPEGNHEGLKRLRPLKKGIFRIAFQAEESKQFNLNLHIVPIGIDYSDYYNAGADLLVVFGTPIKIADYAAQYRENEQRTINTLVNDLSAGMKRVMIHIPEQYYELTYRISEMSMPDLGDTFNANMDSYNRLTIRQHIVQKVTEAFERVPEKVAGLNDAVKLYFTSLAKSGVSDPMLMKKTTGLHVHLLKVLTSLVLLPIYVYGLILNYFPYTIPVWQAAKAKDANFRTSIQFSLSLFLFPVYYVVLIVVFCLLVDVNILRLAFSLSLPISGLFAFYYYKSMQKLLEELRLLKFRLTDKEQYTTLINTRNQIINQIKTTINS